MMWKRWFLLLVLLASPALCPGENADQSSVRLEESLNSRTISAGTPPNSAFSRQIAPPGDVFLALLEASAAPNEKEWHPLPTEWGLLILSAVVLIVGIAQSVFLLAIRGAITRQTEVQKFITRQWVDVGNWSVGGGDPWEPQENNSSSRVASESVKRLKDALTISVNFEVFNRSFSPLSIDTLTVVAGISKNGDWQWKTFEDRSGRVLRPQSLEFENSEAFTVSFDLGDSEIVRYARDGLYTRLHVKVFYFNSEGERIRQDFSVEAVLKPGIPATFTKQRSQKVKEMDRRKPEDIDD